MSELRPITPTGAIAARRTWLRQLERDYGPVSQRLQRAYARTVKLLEPYQSALVDRLIAAADAGEEITPDMVRGLPQWSTLLAQIQIEMNAFARLVDTEASLNADTAVASGTAVARQMTLLTVQDQVRGRIDAGFIRPDPEALRRFIGYVDGPAMRDRLKKLGDNAVQNFGDVMLAGFAQGKHPTVMARAMRNWLGIPYAWGENISRTSYLYSYRGANQATYAANDHLLEGWVWWSALDGSTCISCWSQHGKLFPATQFLNDHHRGKCSPIPAVIGARWVRELASGPDEFDARSDGEKRAILGKTLYELYTAGKLPWGELSKPYQNDVFGEMLRAATAGEVRARIA